MLKEIAKWQPVWTIEKYNEKGELYQVETFKDNLLLNAGITALLTSGATGFLYLGVGDSSTAASASQTGLQASTNKAYAAMDGGYPSITNQTITYKSTFGAGTAAYAWNEFIAIVGNGTGTALNRKVEAHGTKASGDSWVLTLAITIS